MTQKESKKALDTYYKLENMFLFHNKNLTKKQYYIISYVVDLLRELSEKAYRKELKQ